VVLYRFHGRSGVLLTFTGPAAPAGDTVMVGYLRDGNDLVVLDAGGGTGLLARFQNARFVTAEIEGRDVPVGITVLDDDAERAALLERLRRRASIYERWQLRQHREIPVARLTVPTGMFL
jgi:hypothetical protein